MELSLLLDLEWEKVKILKSVENINRTETTETQVVTICFDHKDYSAVIVGSSVCATLPIQFQDTHLIIHPQPSAGKTTCWLCSD